MSASEYVIVFASIVLGLALTTLLVNLSRLLRSAGRIRWDWATPVVAFIVVLLIVQIWWAMFPGEVDPGPVAIAEFLPQLVLLILLFLMASVVLPDEVPDEGLDLRTYYEGTRRYFWTLMSAALGWVALSSLVSALVEGRSVAAVLSHRLTDLVIFSLFVSLIFVRRRWWHALVILVAMTGPIGWLSRSIGGG